MSNEIDWHSEYLSLLEENKSLMRALMAVVLQAGGRIEVSDSLLVSISNKDELRASSNPLKNTHTVEVRRHEVSN